MRMNGSSRDYFGALSGLGFVVLFMTGAIVSNVATTAIYPRPEATPAEARSYFVENAGVVAFLALALAAAGLLLAFFTGALTIHLRKLAPDATKELSWVGVGGGVAAGLLLLDGLIVWTLSREQVVAGSAEALAGLHQLAFATGGAGHVVMLGVLAAAGALIGFRQGVQSRWLTVVGLGSGVFSLASLATLLVLGPVIVLIPLGRFTAFIYIIGMSIRMLRSRT